MVIVRGDGHCLLHALATSLSYKSILEVDCDSISDKLRREVSENIEFYRRFLEDSTYILRDIDG